MEVTKGGYPSRGMTSPIYKKNMSFIAILCILMIWMYFWNDKKGRRQPKQISGTGHGDRGPRKSDSYF